MKSFLLETIHQLKTPRRATLSGMLRAKVQCVFSPASLLFLAAISLPAQSAAPQQSDAAASPPPTTPDPRCPNPDANGKYHIGCGVTGPEVIYKVEPEFPAEASKKKVGSTTTVGLTVDVNGNPINVHVIHSAAEQLSKKTQKIGIALDQKAMEAVSQYKFIPAKLQGKPVAVDIKVEINFQLF
jgi:TonB family protein